MKKRTYLPRRWALTCGNLEKLLSLPVADSLGVNVNESEREQSGIIPRQFCGARRVRAIFRGAHVGLLVRSSRQSNLWRRMNLAPPCALFLCISTLHHALR